MLNEEKCLYAQASAPGSCKSVAQSNASSESTESDVQFDASWYSREYPDVAQSGLPPHEHYRRFGRFLNRRPGPRTLKSELIPECPIVSQPASTLSSPDIEDSLPKIGSRMLRGGFNLPGKDVPIIRGWLAVMGDHRPRTTIVQIGPDRYLEALCDGFRTDLLDNGINAGKHGFELILPIDMVDGKTHRLKLLDKATGKMLAEELGKWVQERNFSDFSGFLGNSYVMPLIYAPFREEDKRCFAVMESIADYFTGLAAALVPRPLVSVIMPVHNRLDTVQESIDSVLGQTHENMELILVDDGSTDGTHALLKKIAEQDKRIVLLNHAPCRGVSYARNRGIAQAKGELICYLDSDNTWDRRYVAATVGAFQHLPDAQAIYGGQMLFRGTQHYPFAVRFGSLNPGLLENRNYIDLNAFSHTRQALQQTGCFDETLARFVDWDFILRMAENVRMYSVPVLLSRYAFDKANNTLTNCSHLFGQLEQVRSSMRHRRSKRAQLLAQEKSNAGPRRLIECERKVSVIIPSYEALPELVDCINSIRNLCTDLIVKIIVVDNASSDPVHRYLNGLAEGGQIRYLRNTVNYGFTHAVNQGLALAERNDDVLLLNNDATLAQNALDVLNEAAYRLPLCGLTVPRQVLPGGTRTIVDHVPYACPENDCDVNLSKHHSNLVGPPVFHHGEYAEVSFAPFFCVYIKREVLDKAAQLDEKHGRHYRSDRIYCDYIRNVLGFRMYHVSAAIAFHGLQRSTDYLQDVCRNGKPDYQDICVNNRWSAELSTQLGFQDPLWDCADINSRNY